MLDGICIGCLVLSVVCCCQMRALGSDIGPGDVLLSNHPAAGGSHLPDLTVITPVFYRSVMAAILPVSN